MVFNSVLPFLAPIPFVLRPSPSSLFALRPSPFAFVTVRLLLHLLNLHLLLHTLHTLHLSVHLQALPNMGDDKPIDIDTLWVHVTCAWFRPEVAFASDEKMEPALGILSIPSSSFVKIRVICKQIHGSCTQCCKCSTYFHAMCASRAGYRMELHISEKNDKQTTKMVFYCAYHRAPNPDNVLIMQILLGVISTKSLLQTKKKRDYEELGHDGNRTVANGVDKEGPVLSKLGSSSTAELHPKNGAQGESKPTNMPPTSVMTRLILIMVWRKLIRNPNTYSSLIGLTWSLISFNLPHKHLRFIPTYTNTGPSPRVDINNNQLQQEEQDDLEVHVEKIIY
ncbi:hypothetical protein Ahy_B08g091683 isoform B [Arachis hypogaea]|uniref:PHD-type domain-containing protein n=1 Tax=Arachis hypogaea TaxID=3818 RepID=A0A444Y2G4_ARAHY|nr:hypothetical protein Ahy_B08g091683 isoform B [Arachis hypogaea]